MEIERKDLDSTSTRTLRRALTAYGNVGNLAQALGVSESELELSINGSETPPFNVFIRALDLALKHVNKPPPQSVIRKTAPP